MEVQGTMETIYRRTFWKGPLGIAVWTQYMKGDDTLEFYDRQDADGRPNASYSKMKPSSNDDAEDFLRGNQYTRLNEVTR